MNWKNIDLDTTEGRKACIIDPYDFDTLLLEIDNNVQDLSKENITAYFESQLREKMKSARQVFSDNLNNIMVDAEKYRNLDEEPNKPTSDEWNAVMNAIKENKGQPHEISKNGVYFYWHFLECLPPLMFSSQYTLCSEAYGGNNKGETTYIGVYVKNDKYFAVIASEREFKELLKA